MEELKWQAVMCHLPLDQFEYIEKTLSDQRYDIGEYLIAHEEKPYSHYHIAFEGSDSTYHKWSKHLFKDKNQLRGRALKGKPRQYGKIHEINDIEKLLTYSCKDGNVKSNISTDRLAKFIENSFKKDDRRTFNLDMIQWIDEQFKKKTFKESIRGHNQDGSYYKADIIKKKVFEFYDLKEIVCGHNQLENQFLVYTQNKLSMYKMSIDERLWYTKYRHQL